MTMLTHDDVEEIVRILDRSPYQELTILTERFELSLRRGTGGWSQEQRVLSRPEVVGSAAPASGPPGAASEAAEEKGVTAIRSPLVGTFYRAPKPGAPPFIEVGSEVSIDTVIGIVETMKLMNSVTAGASGAVIAICAENGQLVEAGQVLARLRSAGT